MNTRRRLGGLVAAGALMLVGCASDAGERALDNAADSKTGGGIDPIVITVADSEPQGRPSNLPLAEFARQVDSLTDGAMNVEIVTEAGADADPGGDQAVIDQLRDGEFEMAVLPARAWSTAGVTSMQPLQAPFLVESDDHLNAVVRDEPVVESLLSGLESVGVHGLTMFPESLRHLFSYTTPILTPQDVVGRQIRYVASPDVAAMITALGATPVDPSGEEFATGVADGTITAADSGYSIALSSAIRPAIATANVVLYAKAITLVADAAFWDTLTDDQRDALDTAAVKTREWAIANQVGENDAAAEYCAGGGAVVLAEPEQVAEFRDAVAPMYAELERHAATKDTIAAIDSLAPTSPSNPIAACGSTTSDVPSELVPDGGDLPNGVYRVDITQEYVKAHGQNDRDAANNYGIHTFRLEDGHWSVDRVAETNCCGPEDSQAGIYQVVGDDLYWKLAGPNDAALAPVHLSWSVDDDGTLHFVDLSTPDSPDYWFDLPWPRIGDV